MIARNLFGGIEANTILRDRVMLAPRAERSYVIHFTPRSGSSWLTDVLGQTNVFGLPDEYFNPSFIPRNATAFGATNLDEYIEVLHRRRGAKAKGGIFGFEITYHQLFAVFGSAEGFLDRFDTSPAVWLIREDIALQAVSLFKMVRGNVSHRPSTSEDLIREADASLAYDNDELVRWTNHIWVAEKGSEEILERRDEPPLRLSYERMMAMGAAGVVERIARHLGVASVPSLPSGSQHQKLGTARNSEFAHELRQRNKDLFARIDEERAMRLDLLSR
jgi:LPS sulfotransferase NodH